MTFESLKGKLTTAEREKRTAEESLGAELAKTTALTSKNVELLAKVAELTAKNEELNAAARELKEAGKLSASMVSTTIVKEMISTLQSYNGSLYKPPNPP